MGCLQTSLGSRMGWDQRGRKRLPPLYLMLLQIYPGTPRRIKCYSSAHLPGRSLPATVAPRQGVFLEAEDLGRARGKAGVGFNQHRQRNRIRCGFVSGHVYINQYFRYNLVNGFNSKRMLEQEKLNGTRESVISRKMQLSTLAWPKYVDCTSGEHIHIYIYTYTYT